MSKSLIILLVTSSAAVACTTSPETIACVELCGECLQCARSELPRLALQVITFVRSLRGL